MDPVERTREILRQRVTECPRIAAGLLHHESDCCSDEDERSPALNSLIFFERAEAQAAMACYRTFSSGLGPDEEDGDDASFIVYCSKPGYRTCPSCKARITRDQIIAQVEGEKGDR